MKPTLITLYSLFSVGVAMADYSQLEDIARRGLEQNIVEIGGKSYLRAGSRQFGSLWTRDFAYSIPGLLAEGHRDVVRDHIDLLLENARSSDGLLPRVMDNIDSRWRVISHLIGLLKKPKPVTSPLRPEYVGEHGTVAIDSNILVLRGALQYLEESGDWNWWNQRKEKLMALYRYYEDKFADGLIVQERYGDWQDSVKRTGATFLTNFHYWDVSQQLREFPDFEVSFERVEQMRSTLLAEFRTREGLFKSHKELEVVSLDGNLSVLDHPHFLDNQAARDELFSQLKRHPLFTKYGLPGFATYPNYPRRWRSLNVQVAGLKNYHDKLYWSWLMAFSAKVFYDYGDQQNSSKILDKLQELAVRDGAIVEIYRPKGEMKAFKSWLYKAEKPFSWGSACVLNALKFIKL